MLPFLLQVCIHPFLDSRSFLSSILLPLPSSLSLSCSFLTLVSGAKVIGSLVASGVLAAVILFSLIYQKNMIPRLLTLGYVAVVVLLFILYFTKVDARAIGLRIFCLFQGVMNGMNPISILLSVPLALPLSFPLLLFF